MKNEIIASYVEKVFAYSLKRTFNYDEAEELSQEILVTAVKELPKLKKAESFEPWLWGIAGNVTKAFSRRMGKQRAMFTYDMPCDVADTSVEYDETDETYSALRTRIAMLSKAYRDIIILYYYDNLSVKQISEKLSLPEGTVTWRLSEARSKLKKECNNMNKTALRPKTLSLNIHGDGDYDGKKRPFPTVYINDALSQNILCYCYEEAQSIEELSKLCGVPAFYIEERVDNLLNRQALVELSKGKYLTDFVIWSDKYGIYLEEHAEKALLPVMDKIVSALENIASDAKNIDFYRAEKTENDLFYLFGAMAFDYMRANCCKLPYPPIEAKYDGYRWCYTGSTETGTHPRFSVSIHHCGNSNKKGYFTHTVYTHFAGISFRSMMYDKYINACADVLYNGSSENKNSVALAIRDGYIIRREDGTLFVTVPSFTAEQKKEFNSLVEKHLIPLSEEYTKCTEKLISGYKKLFPKHLQDEADRFCHHMFFGLYSVVIAYARKTGILQPPSADNHCDVMVEIQ